MMTDQGLTMSKPASLSYALGLRYETTDLARAERFLTAVLDLPVRERGAGYARFDNGSICLWLVEGPGEAPQPPLTIMLAAHDVGEAVRELLARDEVRLVREATWTAPDRLEAELAVEHWLRLVVGRTFNEDELEVVPELETALEWEDGARQLLRVLLKRVPVPFRATAREKAVARSEALAIAHGEVVVQKADAIRGIVEVTPRFQHQPLHDLLVERAEDLSGVAVHFALFGDKAS